MEEIRKRMTVYVNDHCLLLNCGSLRLSSRVEVWGPSAVFFFTAVSLHDMYFIRDIHVQLQDKPTIVIDVNAYVGDSAFSGRQESARRRLRITSRLPDCGEELESAVVTVSASRLQSLATGHQDRSVFEDRMRPVPAVDDYVTPFGRRALPVSF